MAGETARGSTAYVTLEPCCHWGQTPPCTDALIKAGVARVVIAALDPDARVNSRGMMRLRAAGIEVQHGLLESEARDDLRGFFLRITECRPEVTLKLSTTLDGKIATSTGESRWITGHEARRMAHVMRGQYDAVLVGVGTVLSDDPDLNCRIADFRQLPVVRVIADSYLRTPLTSKLLQTAMRAPVWFLARDDADCNRRNALIDLGATVIQVRPGPRGIDLVEGIKALALSGLTSVFVEGGGQVAASFVCADLIERLAWFHAPKMMGSDGLPSVESLGVGRLLMMPGYVRQRVTLLGSDLLTEFKRQT
jgi:diaminohydroxyphosphoribosylaminopyrimidine deaminase/5-amino-6-(5-phosphoribosylamino)uracil reductase